MSYQIQQTFKTYRSSVEVCYSYDSSSINFIRNLSEEKYQHREHRVAIIYLKKHYLICH